MERGVLLVVLVCVAVAGSVSADSDAGHMEPRNVLAACGPDSATVSWSEVVGANLIGYNVFEREAGGIDYAQANAMPVTATSYVVAGLASATAYDFGVSAVYADGASSGIAGPATCTTG